MPRRVSRFVAPIFRSSIRLNFHTTSTTRVLQLDDFPDAQYPRRDAPVFRLRCYLDMRNRGWYLSNASIIDGLAFATTQALKKGSGPTAAS